jgi:cobalt-precorrin-7 (C5)-methyltransferase
MAVTEVTKTKIVIVGCGPGGPDYLTEAARQAGRRAEILIGSRRLLDLFADGAGQRIVAPADTAATVERIAGFHAAGQSVAVLVSGDPGLYSLAQRVIDRFGRQRCEVIAGLSAVQVAFARLGIDWADARILSAHGRTPPLAADDLAGIDKIAILAGSSEALRWSARVAAGLRASHAAFLCENLTLHDERVGPVEPEQLEQADVSTLAIVLLIRRSRIP